jgi:chromate transporter
MSRADTEPRGAPTVPTTPALAALFLRIGNLTFGGGDAITAVLQREFVERTRWLTLDQFGLAQGLARITPGTGILAFSAAAAWMIRRWSGAIAAVLAVSVPSAILTVLLTGAFSSLGGSPVASATLRAVLAAAVGMMWAAAWLLLRPQLRRRGWAIPTLVFLGAFIALARWSISPIQVLAAAALVGALAREPSPR